MKRPGFAFLVWLCVGAGCVSRPPLADLHPVVWGEDGRVTLLSCRWPDRARLRVALHEDATVKEARAVDQALEAWQGAGLGLTLVRVSGSVPDAEVRVRFVSEPPQREGGSLASGLSRADCGRTRHDTWALRRARVQVARQVGPDLRGHYRVVGAEERVGILIHELGHALGHVGHVRALDGPLVAAPEAIEAVGRRALRGESLDSPGLRALYRVPSGSQVAEADVAGWRTQDLDVARRAATQRGWEGPFLRAGDRQARIFWVTPKGRELGFVAPDLDHWRSHPAEVVFLPEPGFREWLARETDQGNP